MIAGPCSRLPCRAGRHRTPGPRGSSCARASTPGACPSARTRSRVCGVPRAAMRALRHAVRRESHVEQFHGRALGPERVAVKPVMLRVNRSRTAFQSAAERRVGRPRSLLVLAGVAQVELTAHALAGAAIPRRRARAALVPAFRAPPGAACQRKRHSSPRVCAASHVVVPQVGAQHPKAQKIDASRGTTMRAMPSSAAIPAHAAAPPPHRRAGIRGS